MFIERLSDDKRIELSSHYLSMIVGVDNSKSLISKGRITKYNDDLTIYISRDGYYSEESISVRDFDAYVSCAIGPVQELINKSHRKTMYRKFGKEYLDALDKHLRVPFESEYKKALEEHEEIMQEIQK